MSTRYVNLPEKTIDLVVPERPLWLSACAIIDDLDEAEASDPYCAQLRAQLEREQTQETLG